MILLLDEFKKVSFPAIKIIENLRFGRENLNESNLQFQQLSFNFLFYLILQMYSPYQTSTTFTQYPQQYGSQYPQYAAQYPQQYAQVQQQVPMQGIFYF
jgi:hypothetical protein